MSGLPGTERRPRSGGVGLGPPLLLLLLAVGVSFWYADRGLPLHDEGAQLTAAARILRGDVFYRDIDAYPFPAAAYALAGAMALFGEHLSVARGLAGLLFCASVMALYAAALAVVGPRRALLFGLALLPFKLIGWPAFSVYLYSDFAFAFACGGLALLLHHRFDGATGRVGLAGLLVGVSVVAKQSLGLPLAGLAVVALMIPDRLGVGPRGPRRAHEVAAFGVGAALPMLAMGSYFAFEGLLGALLHSGFVRPFTGYLPTSGLPFHVPLLWWRTGRVDPDALATYAPLEIWSMLTRMQLPGEALYPLYWIVLELAVRAVYTSIPVAFAWAAWRRFRAGPRGKGKGEGKGKGKGKGEARASRVALLAWLALAFVASAFPRADWFHVVSIYPVVLLLVVALLPPGPRWQRVGAVAVAAWLAGALGLAAIHRSTLDHRLEMARASVDVDPQDAWVAPLVEVVAREIPPGEPLFVYGVEAHFYFLSGRFFPWPFSQLYPGMEGADEGAELARRVLGERPAIVIRGVLHWPGLFSSDRVAPKLGAAMRRHYAPDEAFFERHGGGLPPPLRWVVEVWRPRFGS